MKRDFFKGFATLLALLLVLILLPVNKAGAAEISVGDAAELSTALSAAADGDTIKLTANINYDQGITINGKTINLNSGTFILNVNNGAGIGLAVVNGGLNVTGEMNVTGTTDGVNANNSIVSVNNAIGTTGNGVHVTNGGNVAVYGDARGAAQGAYADGTNSRILINGDAIATDSTSNGVYARDGGIITVNGNALGAYYGVYNTGGTVNVTGDVTTAGVNACVGVFSTNSGTVEIGGNVIANDCSDEGVRATVGSFITIHGDVTAADCTGVYASGGFVTIDGVLTAAPGKYINVGNVWKAPGDYTTPTTKVGYYTYKNGLSVVWVKEAAAADNVCEINGTPYTTLDDALTIVSDGQTIKLLKNIDYQKGIEINLQSITFDLNGFTLNVVNTSGDGLWVVNGGVVLTGAGEFNVTGSDYCVKTDNSTVTVTSATTENGVGIYAQNGGQVTVRGNARGKSYGVYADANSTITVNGNATAFGANGCGARASDGGILVIKGSALATGNDSYGAYSDPGAITINGDVKGVKYGIGASGSNSNITIGGNVVVTGNSGDSVAGVSAVLGAVIAVRGNVNAPNCIGVYCSAGGSSVTVDGAITAASEHYIDLNNVAFGPNDNIAQTTKTGYRTYTDGSDTVWVKEAPPVTPGGGGGGGGLPAGILVTPTGGTFQEQGVTLTFPVNAVGSDVRVQVKEAGQTLEISLPDQGKLLSRIMNIIKDKSGSFMKPVAITLTFNKTGLKPDEFDIAIYFYDEDSSKWIALDNLQLNLEKGTISGETTHFTRFAVIAVPKVKAEKPPVPVLPQPVNVPSDINDHWAKDSILKLINTGVVSGYPDGTFQPNNTITRAEFTVMLVKALDLEPKTGKSFADTASHWAKDSITAAAAHEIVSGFNAECFEPDHLITREQAALIITRAAILEAANDELNFADSKAISSWAKAGVTAAVKGEFITGYPDNSFRPQGNTTRAEAAVIIGKLK